MTAIGREGLAIGENRQAMGSNHEVLLCLAQCGRPRVADSNFCGPLCAAGHVGQETNAAIPWISLSVDSLVELLRTGEVSCPEQWKVTLTDSAKQHAQDITKKEEPFSNMFPDGDEDLKIQVKDLTVQLFDRDQEEIQFRQSIKTLQNEVAVLADVQSENVKLKERIEELEALGDARVATINQWCDRAESFGVRDLQGLTAVSEDYKALRTLMCAEPANVCVEVEQLKMRLLNIILDEPGFFATVNLINSLERRWLCDHDLCPILATQHGPTTFHTCDTHAGPDSVEIPFRRNAVKFAKLFK